MRSRVAAQKFADLMRMVGIFTDERTTSLVEPEAATLLLQRHAAFMVFIKSAVLGSFAAASHDWTWLY